MAPASCLTARHGAPIRIGAHKLDYDAAALKAINVRSIAFLEELRAGWERPGAPCVISGAIGPRGDGYKAAT